MFSDKDVLFMLKLIQSIRIKHLLHILQIPLNNLTAPTHFYI